MRYIFALISVIMICGNGYAAQLKDTIITGTATVTNLKDLSVVTTTTNPNINAGTGVVTTSGIETIVTFNASSTFVVPSGVTSLKVLVVGGGAGGDGGVSSAVYGHGGGGGRVTYRSAFSVTGGSSHTVTIGAGGASGAMDNQASNGMQSEFGTLTAAGGTKANNIGSGGDGGDSGNDIDAVVTNYNGLTDTAWGAAGGAGAGGVGGTVTDAAGGTGGAGYSLSITGSSVAYGTGGDGSGTGTGAPPTIAANLGLGGHGHASSPRSGGSGVVIVRFITTYSTVTVNDKFRLDNNGKVVVGGTTANNSLTVINPNVNGVAIDLRSDDTDLVYVNDFSVARLFADFTSGSYADSRLYLQTATGDNAWKTGLTVRDGSVGVGTTTPSAKVHSLATTEQLRLGYDASNYWSSTVGSTGGLTLAGIGAGGALSLTPTSGQNLNVNLSTTGDLAVNTNQLYVDTSTGYVGYGTTMPGAKLEVYSDSGIINSGAGDTLYQQKCTAATLKNAYSVKVNSYDSVFVNTQNSYPLVFGVSTGTTAGTTVANMTILSTGNVGIGTTLPTAPLDVFGTNLPVNTTNGNLNLRVSDAFAVDIGPQILFKAKVNAGGDYGYQASIAGRREVATADNIAGYLQFSTANSSGSVLEKMRIASNGNVGIGTSTPSAQLHTTGTVRMQNFGAGTATFDANGNISSVSDERLKNVVGTFTTGLNQVLGINPIKYYWNEFSGLDKDNLYTGFSAQNVRKYIPEAVSIDSHGYYNMQDRPLIAALVNSVKQLTKEVDELRVALNLARIDRASVDKAIFPVIKSRINYLEKECEITEIIKEPKEIIELIDGKEVTKTVEVLKEGITERAGKYYRLETYEEASQRYLAISQN